MNPPRILELIERLGNLLRTGQRRAGLEAGLQPVHLQVLGYLARCNRFSNTPAALTAYLGTTKGTVSQTLAVLERNGLVERRADPADGRSVRFHITRAGRAALRRLQAAPDWEAALRTLPAARRAAAESALDQLLRALQHANGQRTFGVCRSCRHLQRQDKGWRCGLNGEALDADDTARICHEHAYPESA
ncbi:MAG: MarR family transcriptional regulator [Gammaproteobacteria bacterium]|nr:MarR family transcriptional regulator [Gammaproteobacteria bacterium]